MKYSRTDLVGVNITSGSSTIKGYQYNLRLKGREIGVLISSTRFFFFLISKITLGSQDRPFRKINDLIFGLYSEEEELKRGKGVTLLK